MDIISQALKFLREKGQAELNAEKQHPLYGQLQAGIRESVAPFLPNKEAKKYQGFSQPGTAGIPGALAKLAGNVVPYAVPMMGTEAAVGGITGRLAARVPQGGNVMKAALSGAAKGAIKMVPNSWTGAFENADSAEDRVGNIQQAALRNIVLGGGAGAMGNAAGYGLQKIFTNKQNPPSTPVAKPITQQMRNMYGQFTAEKIPVRSSGYSPARGKTYSRSTVRNFSL